MNRSSTVLVLALLLATPALAQRGGPKPRAGGPPPACGLKALPLAVGNTWTYKSGSQQVHIKVLEVAPGKDHAGKPATTIVTEESYQGLTVKATHTCTAAGGLIAAVDSFFFSGEPGGGVGATLTVTARDKATLPPDGEISGDQGWVESVKADVARTDAAGAGADHKPAKVEVERHVTVKGDERIMIGLGQFSSAKIIFELRGRGLVDEQRVELPIKRPATMWLARGVGFVKVEDAFDKTWELMDSNVLPR
jgi:hypothetical protein